MTLILIKILSTKILDIQNIFIISLACYFSLIFSCIHPRNGKFQLKRMKDFNPIIKASLKHFVLFLSKFNHSLCFNFSLLQRCSNLIILFSLLQQQVLNFFHVSVFIKQSHQKQNNHQVSLKSLAYRPLVWNIPKDWDRIILNTQHFHSKFYLSHKIKDLSNY